MKVKRFLIVLIFAAVISTVCSASDPNASSGKVDLKLRLKPGESHEMKMTQSSKIPGTLPVVETTSEMEIIMNQNVVDVDTSGVMDVEIAYKSFKIRVEELRCISGCKGDGVWPELTDEEYLRKHGHSRKIKSEFKRVVIMEYDSTKTKSADVKKPAQEMIAAAFSGMAGSKFRMKIKPTGKIYEMDSDANLPMFNKNQFKESLESITGEFPAEPVAVGDIWHDTRNINSPSPMNFATTYMLKQRKNGVVYIDVAAKTKGGGASSTINSTIEADEKSGLVRKSNSTVHFSDGSETTMIIELCQASEKTHPHSKSSGASINSTEIQSKLNPFYVVVTPQTTSMQFLAALGNPNDKRSHLGNEIWVYGRVQVGIMKSAEKNNPIVSRVGGTTLPESGIYSIEIEFDNDGKLVNFWRDIAAFNQ